MKTIVLDHQAGAELLSSHLERRVAPVETNKAKFECLECGRKFSKKLSRYGCEAKCPSCGGYDTEII